MRFVFPPSSPRYFREAHSRAQPVTPTKLATPSPEPPSPTLRPLLKPGQTIGEQLWKTHVQRYKPSEDDLDLDLDIAPPPQASRRRKVSVGEELYQVHLARQIEEVGEDEKDDDDNKDDGKEKEEEVTPPPRDILTAPLEDLCPATPPTKKRSKSEEEREVFDKVSRKVARTRNY
mmetsp:Transcript_7817/g.15598  ORF Transcript_7817/g.15598 Transcript_7817/m.15598 type:complete len:175 (-) Transcript_7817:65-589(-)